VTGVTPRLGVALGTIGLSASEWLDCAGELSQLPIERVWIWDHLIGRGAPERPVLEAISLAAAALARHESLAVGTLVLDVTKRHPALAAKSIATIASLAEGRFAVGLGAGGDAGEHQALGMEFGAAEERLTLLEETIGIFRAMLEGDPKQRVTRPSRGVAPSLMEAASAPRPAHQVPLYVAGDHERSIDLAARSGDGWIAPAATFAQGITRFRSASERAGRTGLVAFALQELGKGESLRETPFGRDPRGWLAAQADSGADSVVITVRDRSDVAQLSAMIGSWRTQ
jgi:alkanesulfonate monooxygenase SsuD/methylene tetrahydromethanopterin reductase-like flavin-dependent oxidoreductase (luciferase family)